MSIHYAFNEVGTTLKYLIETNNDLIQEHNSNLTILSQTKATGT